MATMSREVLVAGVGMIPFTKPGQSASYDEMGAEAIRLAIADGGVSYDLVEQAFAGFVFGASCAGQRTIYKAGMAVFGPPIGRKWGCGMRACGGLRTDEPRRHCGCLHRPCEPVCRF